MKAGQLDQRIVIERLVEGYDELGSVENHSEMREWM